MRNLAFVCGVLVVTAACAARAGTLVTPDELARRDAWVKASFEKLAPADTPSSEPNLPIRHSQERIGAEQVLR